MRLSYWKVVVADDHVFEETRLSMHYDCFAVAEENGPFQCRISLLLKIIEWVLMSGLTILKDGLPFEWGVDSNCKDNDDSRIFTVD